MHSINEIPFKNPKTSISIRLKKEILFLVDFLSIFNIWGLFYSQRYLKFLKVCRWIGCVCTKYQKIIAKEKVGINVSNADVKALLLRHGEKLSKNQLSRLSCFHCAEVYDFLKCKNSKIDLKFALKKRLGIGINCNDKYLLENSKNPDALLIVKEWRGLTEYFYRYGLLSYNFNDPWCFDGAECNIDIFLIKDRMLLLLLLHLIQVEL